MRLEEALKTKGVYVTKTEGNSMEPMLKQGRDRVVIVPPTFPLKKYDVPVYHRDDHYTMHRIIKVLKNGKYVIVGDNRCDYEYDITDNEIVGVLKAFYQGDKYIECTDKEYLKYVKRMRATFPVRWVKHFIWRVRRKLKQIVR